MEYICKHVNRIVKKGCLSLCYTIHLKQSLDRVFLEEAFDRLSFSQRRNARCAPLSMKLRAPKQLGPEGAPAKFCEKLFWDISVS